MEHGGVDLNQVDLNLLVALDALVDERSVTRAASRLCVGQPAMSATLARLRALFDDPILVRDGREMVPTPFALGIAKPVHEVLDDIRAILDRSRRFDPATAERDVAVVASDYVTMVFLTPFTARLAEEAPGVRLHVTPPTPELPAQLRSGVAELGIVPREAYPTYDTMPHVELFTDRFVCAVDIDNAEVGDSITLDQFASLPYLAGSCGHQVSPAEAQLDALGVHRNVEMTTAYGLAPLLLAGTGMIALIHERLAEAVGARASLRLLDPPLPLEPIHEVLLWSGGTDTDPGLRWLRGRMMAVAAELDADRRTTTPARSDA